MADDQIGRGTDLTEICFAPELLFLPYNKKYNDNNKRPGMFKNKTNIKYSIYYQEDF
jgi:hypothetical protein